MDAQIVSRVRHTHRAKAAPLDERQLYAAAETFKTLSDPTRLKILRALADGDTCVHELCDQLGMNQPAVSHQLRLLRVQRLVRTRRAGREIYYSILDDHVLSLLAAACSHASEEG